MTAPERGRRWIPIDVMFRAAELREERWLDEHRIRTDSPATTAGRLRKSTGRIRSSGRRAP